jgi:hypothetical protein
MAVIGLAYLVINAWWIRQSLRQPPPSLGELVLPVLPPDTHVPGTEPEEDDEAPTPGQPA